ncbi:uncharacterized protein LOC122028760 isoform X1 [Zingiber officinale]|uniref:uncharacterized protein LOC122028760 isoform X1 n=1 Tax=Zingiber officinale TaxID=94328 RepID=UPI001C4AC246|nr:uncharacterized protein LOC122028760 isoform X1 [Zingiber officinale]
MVIHTLPLPSLLPPFNPRRRLEAKASATVGDPGSGRNKANLSARRQERVFIPNYCDGNGRAFPISDFFRHPTGMEALLNTRALQRFELLDANTFRCTLYKIQFLKFEVSPVIDLQVTPTDKDCTVEMLSCRFEGSNAIEKQNQLFSAFMRNHITWEADNSEPCLVVDVNLRIALDVYTKPFSLLPLSAVEKPGNLVMQGLLDRLVPLLAEKLHSDYCAWVEQQMNSQL